MNFDPVARHYGWLERLAFFGAMQRCRLALLDQLGRPGKVLILGEGTGRFLEALSPRAESVTVVDSSAAMIRRARQRVRADAVRYLHGDARDILLEEHSFDLLVTHFFLDCFDECDVRQLIRKYAALLPPGGRWLWSDFVEPDRGWMKWPARGIVSASYAFFARTCGLEVRTLVAPGALFREAGLEPIAERQLVGGLFGTVLFEKPIRGPARTPRSR